MGEFNLAEVLRGQLQRTGDVSESDTSGGREQIEYIPLDRIDSDPNNFYNLSGVDELAANIELLGLQQPLRVRQDPQSPDRVIIVSGHRRRAALEKLVAEGREDLREVPCIRDQSEGSTALQELRLIYANSDTRVLTPAELSRQAERVELLLYQLKEEGLEFPGRMRDQVAAACRISAPKLARLKVIREKLAPEYMTLFEKNKLPEQTAYTLARLPEDFQKRMASVLTKVPRGAIVEKVLKKYDEGWRWEPELQCPDGKTCRRGDAFLRRDCEASGWQSFCGGKTCCLECEQAKAGCYPCERMCSKAKAQRKAAKDEAEKAAHQRSQKAGRRYQKETQVYAKRLLPAINAAGLSENVGIPWRRYRDYPRVFQVRQWAAGEFNDPAKWHEAELVPDKCECSLEAAKLLGCSTDFLLGLTDELRPAADVEPPPQENPVPEADETEAELKESTGDVSESDTIFEDDDDKEPPARRVRWESRGLMPPENRLILTYRLGEKGPMFRAAIWDGTQFRPQDGGASITASDYTHWLEIPGPASGDTLLVEPLPEPEGQLVISGWMPGGTFPWNPCDAVADFRISGEPGRPGARLRRICWFDGADFLFKRHGPRIDAECVRWMVLPPVKDNVSESDTAEEAHT